VSLYFGGCVGYAADAWAAEGRKWDKPVTQLHVSGVPLSLAFHSFDSHVVIANETDGVWSVFVYFLYLVRR
jgi:hypothetical protein